jgi:hypothetical protein
MKMTEHDLRELFASYLISPQAEALPQTEFTPYVIIAHVDLTYNITLIGAYTPIHPETGNYRLRRGLAASQHALSLLLDVHPGSRLISRRWFAGQSFELESGSLYVCVGGAKRDFCASYIQSWVSFLQSQ